MAFKLLLTLFVASLAAVACEMAFGWDAWRVVRPCMIGMLVVGAVWSLSPGIETTDWFRKQGGQWTA